MNIPNDKKHMPKYLLEIPFRNSKIIIPRKLELVGVEQLAAINRWLYPLVLYLGLLNGLFECANQYKISMFGYPYS